MSFTAYWNGEWVPGEGDPDRSSRPGIHGGRRDLRGHADLQRQDLPPRDHIRRLYRSLDYIRLDPGLSEEEMGALTEEAVRAQPRQAGHRRRPALHHFVTRGKGRRAWSADGAQVGIRVSGLDFSGYYEAYEGLKAVITRTQSYHAEPSTPNQALQPHELQPRRAGGQRGSIPGACRSCETATGTSPKAPPTTSSSSPRRRAYLDHADRAGRGVPQDRARPRLAARHRDADRGHPALRRPNAGECFFTSTSWCLVPVTTVDKRPVGDGNGRPRNSAVARRMERERRPRHRRPGRPLRQARYYVIWAGRYFIPPLNGAPPSLDLPHYRVQSARRSAYRTWSGAMTTVPSYSRCRSRPPPCHPRTRPHSPREEVHPPRWSEAHPDDFSLLPLSIHHIPIILCGSPRTVPI